MELADIELENQPDEGAPHGVSVGSWVDIILFLQTSLKLEAVRLDGTLTNQSDEVWESHEPNEPHAWPSAWRPSRGSWLKHRIEQYIVEGGAFRFPTALEVQKAGGWEHMDFGDSSWEFRVEDSSWEFKDVFLQDAESPASGPNNW